MYKIDRRGGIQKSYTRTDPILFYILLERILRWCIFRLIQICCNPLLTYAKSAVLNIRPNSTLFYSCYMDLWPQRPVP